MDHDQYGVSVLAFLRGFPQTPATLCTEPVVAWLARRGHDPRGLDAKAQRAIYRRAGFARGVMICARRLGLVVQSAPAAKVGAVVLIRAQNQMFCGLALGQKRAVIAASGSLRVIVADRLYIIEPA
jgi:hypothetical protein